MTSSNTCPAPRGCRWLGGRSNGVILPRQHRTLCVGNLARVRRTPLTRIGIYPFPDADPFIIHHRPHVYIIGNQPEFETAMIGGQLPPPAHIIPGYTDPYS